MGQLPFAGDTPGVNLRTVLREASAEDVEFLVGGTALRIVKLLDGDLSQPDRLREVVAEVAYPTELVGRKERGERLLSLLSSEQLAKLAGRLRVDRSPGCSSSSPRGVLRSAAADVPRRTSAMSE